MKKEFIKLSAILCIITLVAALLLAGVNKITAPRIVQAEKDAAEQAMKKILPDADSFEQLNENVYLALQGRQQVSARKSQKKNLKVSSVIKTLF